MPDNKRQIYSPPYQQGFFRDGEFVYDPEGQWDDLRVGIVNEVGDTWFVSFPPKIPGDQWNREPLATYKKSLGRHILIDHSGIGPARGPDLDPEPWQLIYRTLQGLLRDTKGNRVRLKSLIRALKSTLGLDPLLVEDTVRMCASMGFANVRKDKGGYWLGTSEIIQGANERKDYLASFSEELLAKSRRIDNLIRHSGTVGSYREELVRSLLRQLLPTRYEISTGFIENSPRQLDAIVWDAANFSPLFREQNVVVVPMESVRAILEIKTTLDSTTLFDALEILADVTRRNQTDIPIFKGIFAFESRYKSDDSIAQKMREFYNEPGPNELLPNAHTYLFQGIDAVCVPKQHYIYQQFVVVNEEPERFPFPILVSHTPAWSGDVRTGIFLGELLSHLDLEAGPKQSLMRMFYPMLDDGQPTLVVPLYPKGWQPTQATSRLVATLQLGHAREYAQRIMKFRQGVLTTSAVLAGLDGESSLPIANDLGSAKIGAGTSLD